MALIPVCSGSFTGCRCDTWRQTFHRIELGGVDGSLAVYGRAQRVHYAAHHLFAHRNGHDARRAAHFIAFANVRVVAEQDRAHLVFLQVHGDARNVVRKLDQFAGHHLLQAVNARDAIAHRDHRAGLADVDGPLVVFNLLP